MRIGRRAVDGGFRGPARTDLGRYLGRSVIVGQETVGDAVATTFGGRAACMRGDPFVASTRDVGSRDLVFFLQGGGACWDDFVSP